jgi:hypothetical protein
MGNICARREQHTPARAEKAVGKVGRMSWITLLGIPHVQGSANRGTVVGIQDSQGARIFHGRKSKDMKVFMCQCGYTFILDLENAKVIGPMFCSQSYDRDRNGDLYIGNKRKEVTITQFLENYGDCWNHLLQSIPEEKQSTDEENTKINTTANGSHSSNQ